LLQGGKQIGFDVVEDSRHGCSLACESALSGMALFRRGMVVPEKRRGVTYSRSITGTDMPSTKRSQARPIGRASKRRSLSRNCPFRDEQQPKLRELFFVKIS
jgi:hypothetical protein